MGIVSDAHLLYKVSLYSLCRIQFLLWPHLPKDKQSDGHNQYNQYAGKNQWQPIFDTWRHRRSTSHLGCGGLYCDDVCVQLLIHWVI